MNSEKTIYHGYVLQALAAYDDGAYASMYIVQPPGGAERVSPVLGHFASTADARRFALIRGKTEVDNLLNGQVDDPKPAITVPL